MLGLLGLIATASLAGAWRASEKAQINKWENDYHREMDGTNIRRQDDLFLIYSTGKDEDGNPLTEPHKAPQEVYRLVKKQLEKEGIRYYHGAGRSNLKHCVFNEKGELVSINGHKYDRERGRVIY